jgi:hypothetical protein
MTWINNFDYEYVYGTHLRWDLGLGNPNHAAALLACLAPWITGFTEIVKRRHGFVAWMLYLALQLGLVALVLFLCKTYSRGGLAALIGGIGTFVALMYHVRRGASRQSEAHARRVPDSSPLSDFLRVLLVLLVIILITDFSGRIQSTSNREGAVGNRIECWTGSLRMISASPISGWGNGESGRSYMNWYQQPSRTERFRSPVNSFLHVGVEYGVFPLALAIALFGTVLFLPAVKQPTTLIRGPVQAAGKASLVAWLVANIFTTLWINPYLWLVPAFSFFATISIGLLSQDLSSRAKVLFRGVSFGALLSISVCGAVLLAGNWLDRDSALRARPGTGGETELKRHGARGDQPKFILVPDTAVIGDQPGKEFRTWMLANPTIGQAVVLGTNSPLPTGAQRRIVLFGYAARRAAEVSPNDELWLIHPLGPIPKECLNIVTRPGHLHVQLPEIDETGDAARWRTWGEASKAELNVSTGCGSDIRPIWPAVSPLSS